jgi:hypothetical protein
MILRDDISQHRKFLLAGQLIGGTGGAARALALYVGALGYARKQLTDGFVDDEFVTKFLLDSDAKLTAKVLASRKVKLFHRVRGGYRIHDYHKHNGSADKLRQQRDLACARKRRQRAGKAVENSVEHSAVGHASRHLSRGSHAYPQASTDTEKEYVQQAVQQQPATAVRTSDLGTVEVPLEQRADARDLSRAQKTDTLSREPAADANVAVLVKLTHQVMAATGIRDTTSPDLVEAVKQMAARHRIQYPVRSLGRALSVAAHAQVRR